MDLEVKNMEGGVVGTMPASDYVWAEPMNGPVLHQAVVAQQANRRQGTHSARGRSQVIGSRRKVRSQKHTGRARLGDAKAPGLRGGGVAHGPHPRDHRKRLPARMRHLALRIALSEKVRGGNVVVLDRLSVPEPSTKAVTGMVEKLELSGTVLLVALSPDETLRASVRNLASVDTIAANLLNPLETQRVRNIVISREAVETVDRLWGHPKPRPARRVGPARGTKVAQAS